MHSSRVRTACSSSHHDGVSTPPEQAPQPDPPQLPPWVWAWTRSPSTSPLGVGLDQIPLNFPLGCGPGQDPPKLTPWLWAWKPARYAGIPPPPPQRPAARHAGIPPAMHAGIAPLPPPHPHEHRRLWKYNLAPTSLQVVIKTEHRSVV